MKALLVIAAVLAVGACGSGYTWSPYPGEAAYGRVASEADAILAAQALTDLKGSVVVRTPRRGRAADLYTGIYGSCVAGMSTCDELAARRDRTAWRVDLAGRSPSACPLDPCPPSLNEELIIDEATGVLLYSDFSPDPLPLGRGEDG
jgi:hypothetical protein